MKESSSVMKFGERSRFIVATMLSGCVVVGRWWRGGWHGDVGVRWRKGGRVLGQRGEVGGRLCFGDGGTIGVLLGGVGTGLCCWGVGGQVSGCRRLWSLCWLV